MIQALLPVRSLLAIAMLMRPVVWEERLEVGTRSAAETAVDLRMLAVGRSEIAQ